VAHTTVPILLNGESGTGKERFARAIHQSSPRRKKPFIAINCGAIPKELLASELFGYEEGTFTGAIRGGRKGKFEQADGGTLFLDEIGEMPLGAQVHLLRVLQEQEVLRLGGSRPHKINVRVIAATNRDLTCMIGSGQFRPDLYYRLNVVAMTIPPLRERLPDVPLLVRHFIRHFGQRYDKPGVEIDENLMQGLQRYHWPGNIRELENAIEHAVLFSEGECLLPHHFPAAIEKVLKHNVDKQSLEFNRNYSGLNPAQLEERRILLQLLDDTNGNLSEMARRMRVARTTLYRRLQKYQIRI
jgi:transcriptional regulator with PAS, ATPase and Fis domain